MVKWNIKRHKSAILLVGNQAHQNSLKSNWETTKVSISTELYLPLRADNSYSPKAFCLLKADFPRTKSSFKAAFNKRPETVITPPSLPVCLN